MRGAICPVRSAPRRAATTVYDRPPPPMKQPQDPNTAETVLERPRGPAAASAPAEVRSTLRGVDASAIDGETLFAPGERYRPGALLGRGGMGDVRLCLDERVGREVAIKTLRVPAAEGTEAWRRFVREARVQGQLEHPAVVPVYDIARDLDGALFFSMRRVQGASLADVIARLAAGDPEATARWTRRRLLTAFVQVCLAVDYAHSRGVVHRDLKPANVMLGDFGEVQVLDWGIAHVGAGGAPEATTSPPGDDAAGLTADGEIMGTVAYMPPEQIVGDVARISARTDVYALGLVLYEALALQGFHAGVASVEVCRRAAAGIDPRPSRVVSDVAPELDEACAAATRNEPEDRLPSARALADAVERYLDGESDRARRHALAVDHGARALTSLDAPGAASDPVVRRSAMRDALQSMALDPAHPEGRTAFLRLLTEAPATLPPPVERDLEDAAHAARREGLGMGMWAWVLWLLTTPLLLFVGTRSPWVFAVPAALCLFGAGLSRRLARHRRLSRWHVALYASTFAVFVACLSGWLGPFILVPTAASTLILFGILYARPRERVPLIALSVASVAVPLALEAAGVLPASYRFVPEGVLLVPRALDAPPGPTTFALLWTSLSFIVAPALYLGRMRDALGVAERRLALQAWQLRQIGDEPPQG